VKVPNWATNLFNSRRTTTTERTTLEEQKEIIDKAELFDKLSDHPGWEQVCRFMVAKVQTSIAEATKAPDLSKKQLALVLRWNAQRDLLDDTLGYIEGIRRSRDQIVEAYKQYGQADIQQRG
jgi:hypothetical protein